MVAIRMKSHQRRELYLCDSKFLGSQQGPPNTRTGHTLGFITAGQVGLVKFNVGDGPGE